MLEITCGVCAHAPPGLSQCADFRDFREWTSLGCCEWHQEYLNTKVLNACPGNSGATVRVHEAY